MRHEFEMDMPHCIIVRCWLHPRRRGCTYSMYRVFSPVAQVEQDVPPSGLERIRHDLESIKRYLGRPDSAHVITAVIFEHVDTPLGKAVGIIDLMIERSGCFMLSVPGLAAGPKLLLTETSTGHLAGTAIHAILQALTVKMI